MNGQVSNQNQELYHYVLWLSYAYARAAWINRSVLQERSVRPDEVKFARKTKFVSLTSCTFEQILQRTDGRTGLMLTTLK